MAWHCLLVIRSKLEKKQRTRNISLSEVLILCLNSKQSSSDNEFQIQTDHTSSPGILTLIIYTGWLRQLNLCFLIRFLVQDYSDFSSWKCSSKSWDHHKGCYQFNMPRSGRSHLHASPTAVPSEHTRPADMLPLSFYSVRCWEFWVSLTYIVKFVPYEDPEGFLLRHVNHTHQQHISFSDLSRNKEN